MTIGSCLNAKGLYDLGVKINLMRSSMFRRLGLRDPTPTTILLQLVDHLVGRPDGNIEDVLVQVRSSIFLVDFLILDFEPNLEVPFILGCPFLATRGVLIDVSVGRLTLCAR